MFVFMFVFEFMFVFVFVFCVCVLCCLFWVTVLKRILNGVAAYSNYIKQSITYNPA